MIINIDYTTGKPIYLQIVREIEKQITLGVLVPNHQIPSVRSLAYDLGINPNTVKKAYDILEENGLIISKSTKGFFICDNIEKAKEIKIKELLNKIEELMKELKSYGLTREEVIKRIKENSEMFESHQLKENHQ